MPVFFSLLYRNTSLIYCIVAKWQAEWVPEETTNMLSPANALGLVRSFPTDISLSPSEEQLINKQVGSLALAPVFKGLLRWFWKSWAWGVAQQEQLWVDVTPHGRSGCGKAVLQLDTLLGIALCPEKSFVLSQAGRECSPLWSLGAKNSTGCGVPDFTAQEMCDFLHKILIHSLLLTFRICSSLHDRP